MINLALEAAKRGIRPDEPDGGHLESHHGNGCSCQLLPPPRRAVAANCCLHRDGLGGRRASFAAFYNLTTFRTRLHRPRGGGATIGSYKSRASPGEGLSVRLVRAEAA